MPKISVIVPVYKVEKYLARCVDSILAQAFKDYELILVDDGSPDNCPAMCDEYAAKYDFIKVIHQKNQGAAVARNVGIEYALTTKSKWIAFIDSDDWVHPQYLEILYNACIENNAEISCCGFNIIKDYDPDFAFAKISKTESLKGNSEFLFLKGMNTYAPWGKLYKKECFQYVRFPEGKLFEDMRTVCKVLYPCRKIIYIINKLYYYFYNESGASFSEFTIDKSIDEIMAYEEHLMYLYENKFYLAADMQFGGCKILVDKLLNNYSGEQVELVYNRFCDINEKIFSDKKFIKALKKRESKNKLKALKEDFNIVKKEKNTVYAILFYIKHFWKAYFGK